MKIIYAFIFALTFTASLSAQIGNDEENYTKRQEKMQSRVESQKVAFITQKLDLSPTEAQNFWPLYNEFQSNMKDLRQKNRLDLQYDDINENEAKGFLDNLLKREQEELDLKKGYFEKLKTVLSAKKVAQLYILEKKFREEILANIRTRMGKKKRKMRKNKGY